MTEHLSATPGHAHEQRDLHARTVAWCGVILGFFLAISLVLIGEVYERFQGSIRQGEQTPTALIETRPLPPKPHLQQSPRRDLQAMRAAEASVLESYGWVDHSAGIGRIPITHAMAFLVERGLPAWGTAHLEGREKEETRQ